MSTKKRRGRPPKTITADDLIGLTSQDIDVEKILTGVMKHVGGIDTFGKIIAEMLKAEGPGSGLIKGRAMAITADLTKFATTAALGRTPLPEDLSNEELDKALEDCLERIAKRQEAEAAKEAHPDDAMRNQKGS